MILDVHWGWWAAALVIAGGVAAAYVWVLKRLMEAEKWDREREKLEGRK